ncbi:MBL fold metallo-hydrolase [Telluribacter humicola]|uniref:MBL fold metallo-hydrolase n=1 Tax=Telluribacter humicola TaxID=1720261 RepID=UPI001E4DB13E|nr:MBL fold metallo-hydrolase [Telluribacter humicola]
MNNPDLKTILSSWQGTPVDKHGRFMNHEFPGTQTFGNALKWTFEKNPQKQTKKNDTWHMQVVKDDNFLHTEEDVVVLLGHSTFFIRLDGKQLVIDPVFGDLSMHTRYTDFPIETAKLVNIDYVLISHSHYDHCDKASLKIIQSQNPDAVFLAGLGMKDLLSQWVGTNEVQQAGWYQQYKLDDGLEIYFLPARHSSRRFINDTNKRLWGAFVLKSKKKTIYYGGDSGYGSHYREAGELFPGIDVALIGVGAYSPRWFMLPNHQDPQQAVQAFNDIRATMMIPFHYGTFDMADEPLSEPEDILSKAAEGNKVKHQIRIVKPGEAVILD